MIEVEIKLPLKEDIMSINDKLIHMGFHKTEELREVDGYLDNADQKIRRSGQALRIREITDRNTGDKETVLTFKGEKLDTVSMSRQELETGLGDAQTGVKILKELGYSMVPPAVVKNRTSYEKAELTACVDDVHGLGLFLELECMIAESEDRRIALRKLEECLVMLGYGMEDTVTNSYLSMLMGIQD